MEQVSKYQFYSFQAIPQPNFDAAMEELAAKFEAALKQNLAKPYPYAPGFFGQKKQTGFRDMKKKTGNLYNSINVSFDSDANRMRVQMLDYWKNVNDGRQPGTYVPLEPLKKWIRIKGLNRDPKGRFKKFNIKGVAAAISKSIKENGIQPTNFYDDSFDVFLKAFNDPNGPIAKLGIDLQTFLTKILKDPNK
jgi:hypothetical protein